MSALDDPQPNIRSVAAGALSRWGVYVPLSIPKLMTLLSDSDHSVAGAAANALSRMTNRMDAAIPSIRKLLTNPSEHTRSVAAISLWRLGENANNTRRVLESLLTSKNAKSTAARYLESMGAEAHPSVEALLSASREDVGAGTLDIYFRAQCARAALTILGRSDEAISTIQQALTYPSNSWVRTTVAEELGNMGELATPLIPALRQSLNDPDRGVRHQATMALSKLEKE
ncbi:MAG: HEAT repeat domain-containing protein [Verrucomicrobia bacterium]|nr:HEAT repeat domain-containing protein [Verrucomicrobiota bacterium]